MPGIQVILKPDTSYNEDLPSSRTKHAIIKINIKNDPGERAGLILKGKNHNLYLSISTKSAHL
jgi:hypothetical protein